MLFLPWGNTANYPALVLGLVAPGVGWAPYAALHYGGEGEMNNWANWYYIGNPTEAANVKGADMNLVTYEYEAQAKLRDTYIAYASIAVVDNDAPKILEPLSVSGWKTGANPLPIPYSFEDQGLGVRSAAVRLTGDTEWRWGTDFGCSGAATLPCPRLAKSSEPGRPALTYVPSQLPTGIDRLEVIVGDPTWAEGHTAQSAVYVAVDNTAPELTLSGPLTEQDFPARSAPNTQLTISAEDGANNAPQSGVAKVEVKVDGKKITMPKESAWNPNCQSQNCSFSGTWTLKAAEYTAGRPRSRSARDRCRRAEIATTALEIELGQEPLQTSFTSPHPSYAGNGLSLD